MARRTACYRVYGRATGYFRRSKIISAAACAPERRHSFLERPLCGPPVTSFQIRRDVEPQDGKPEPGEIDRRIRYERNCRTNTVRLIT